MVSLMSSRRLLAAAVVLAALLPAASVVRGAAGDWTQWGGPTRNFMIDSTGLATTWPAGGPKKLWSRALGEGHSSILAEGTRLFTMYRVTDPAARGRRGEKEAVVALDAATGKTVWEHVYPAPTDGLDFEYGAGPHATPLIVGTRLFTASTLKDIFAFDKVSGRLLWSHSLMKDYGAPK